MMDEKEYEDYLVDKAKELLNENLESPGEVDDKPEMKHKRNKMDEKAEKDSTSKIPFSWDPREIQHLEKNRKKMSNKELKKFLQKDSELHEDLEKFGEWNGFSRWEERFIVQNYQNMTPEEISDQMERQEKEIRLKMRMMGLNPGDLEVD